MPQHVGIKRCARIPEKSHCRLPSLRQPQVYLAVQSTNALFRPLIVDDVFATIAQARSPVPTT